MGNKPKARRTGGLEYEPVKFAKDKLRDALINIYESTYQKQLVKRDRKTTRPDRRDIGSIPLWKIEDTPTGIAFGIMGTQYSTEMEKKSQPHNSAQKTSLPYRQDGYMPLKEYLDQGGTFSELFANEIIEKTTYYLLAPQLTEQLCCDADLRHEAERNIELLESLGKELTKTSPGLHVQCSALREFVNDIFIWAECFRFVLEPIAKRIEKEEKRKEKNKERPEKDKEPYNGGPLGARGMLSRLTKDLIFAILEILSKYQIPITASGSQQKSENEMLYSGAAGEIIKLILAAYGYKRADITIRDDINSFMKMDQNSCINNEE